MPVTLTNSADSFFMFAGDDVVFALAGNDVIQGAGAPYFSGEATIFLDAGADRFNGTLAPANEVIVTDDDDPTGAYLKDVVNAGGGDDRIFSNGATFNNERDELFGGSGNDVIDATNSAYLHGGSGNDRLIGRSGVQTLVGGSGNDQIEGGAGSDRIWFGNEGFGASNAATGKDAAFGGTGADKFFVQAGGGVNNLAVIRDFNVAVDFISIQGNVTFQYGAFAASGFSGTGCLVKSNGNVEVFLTGVNSGFSSANF